MTATDRAVLRSLRKPLHPVPGCSTSTTRSALLLFQNRFEGRNIALLQGGLYGQAHAIASNGRNDNWPVASAINSAGITPFQVAPYFTRFPGTRVIFRIQPRVTVVLE